MAIYFLLLTRKFVPRKSYIYTYRELYRKAKANRTFLACFRLEWVVQRANESFLRNRSNENAAMGTTHIPHTQIVWLWRYVAIMEPYYLSVSLNFPLDRNAPRPSRKPSYTSRVINYPLQCSDWCASLADYSPHPSLKCIRWWSLG